MDLTLVFAFVVAFAVASVTSLGGISGAFLLLPFQVSVLGIAGPVVTPTNHLYNVIAIPSGVYRYFREQRLLWPLTTVIIVGTVPGVVVGSLIRIYLLPDPRNFKLFVGLVLLLIGSRMVGKLRRRTPPPPAPKDFVVEVTRFDLRRLEYRFQGNQHGAPVPALFALTAVIGVIGGAYGVGGGAIIAPFLVSLWNLPVHTIAGATLLGTCLTSVVGVLFFQLAGSFSSVPQLSPNWLLGLALGAGGLCGMYVGARLQRFLPARAIEVMLALVVNGLGASYVVGFWLR